MVRRTDTPLRWLRCGLLRASWLISATTSARYAGTLTVGPPAGTTAAEIMMAASIRVVGG